MAKKCTKNYNAHAQLLYIVKKLINDKNPCYVHASEIPSTLKFFYRVVARTDKRVRKQLTDGQTDQQPTTHLAQCKATN